jgi:hypothetical protein
LTTAGGKGEGELTAKKSYKALRLIRRNRRPADNQL